MITDPIVQQEVRDFLNKPEGELSLEDLAKVSWFEYEDEEVTDESLKDVAKLQNLIAFGLSRTKVTKAGVAELKKALPKCEIISDHD